MWVSQQEPRVTVVWLVFYSCANQLLKTKNRKKISPPWYDSELTRSVLPMGKKDWHWCTFGSETQSGMCIQLFIITEIRSLLVPHFAFDETVKQRCANFQSIEVFRKCRQTLDYRPAVVLYK